MSRIEKRFTNRVKCEIQPKRGGNNVDGKTVVASCDLERGDVVCYVCGVVYNEVKDDYTPASGKFHGDKMNGLYVFHHFGRNMAIDPHDHISRLINHSCKPSCSFRWNKEKEIIEIYTSRCLSKGDEITINYGRSWFENHDIECRCGSSKCYDYLYEDDDEDENDSDAEQEATLIKCAEEGELVETQTGTYKRDKKLRREVLDRDKCTCQICKSNLSDVYGDFAEEVIEVHHKKPLKDNQGKSQTTNIDDLIALCPNCHRVLHACYDDPNDEAIKDLRKQYRKCQRRKTK